MHKSFKTFGLAGTAMALALTPAMVAAQVEAARTNTSPSMPDTNPAEASGEGTAANADAATTALTEADRDSRMQSWPAEQRTAYNTWAPETQTYFWTLNEERQGIFWRITDGDKTALTTMAEPQREATWVELETRLQVTDG